MMLFFPLDEQENKDYQFLMLPKPDVANANGIVIPKYVMDTAIEKFTKQISEGSALVTYGQSESVDMDRTKVVGSVTGISYRSESNTYVANIKLNEHMPNTPAVKEMLKCGFKCVMGTNKIANCNHNQYVCNDPNLKILSMSMLDPCIAGLAPNDPDII